jgi:hypothetical protein
LTIGINSSKIKENKENNRMAELLKSERPEYVTNDMLIFLDELRESGITNMWGARPYVLDEFPELSKDQAGHVVTYWMKTFGNEDR